MKAFLARIREQATLDDAVIYKQVTVKLYGKGAVLRKTLPGMDIRTRPQFLARSGQLIMSRIDARNGAFAIVPPELDCSVVTQDFPLYEIDCAIVEPKFLALLLQSHSFVDACKRASRGTTNRKRLKEATLLEETITLPNKDVQHRLIEFASLLESLGAEIKLLTRLTDGAIPDLANSIFV